MKLYGNMFSSNTRRVVVTAAACNTKLEFINVDLAKGEARTPAFLAMNPNGKVPVLVDGECVLWESMAIMQYLAEKANATNLYPTEAAARADVNRWMFWHANHFGAPIGTLNREIWLKPMLGWGPTDYGNVEKATAEFNTYAALMNQHLRDHAWLCHNRMTLADITIGSALMTDTVAKLPVAAHPHLARWLTQFRAQACWQATEQR